VDTVLLYIAGVVIVAVGVLLSILLHELGHFIPAKLFKVHVGQFMVGFGQTLWSRKYKGTEFGIKALPLGGYISMAGMYPPAAPGGKARTASSNFFQTLIQDARDQSGKTIVEGAEDRVFYKLAIGKRIIIMLGGPIMNLIIATVLTMIIMSGFGVQSYVATVNEVDKCVLPASSTSTTCPANYVATPAAKAGFRVGDKLETLNGTKVTSWAQAVQIIGKLGDKNLIAVVQRDGRNVTLHAVPRVSERYEVNQTTGQPVLDAAGNQVIHKTGFLGIGPSTGYVQQPISQTIPTVWTNTGAVAGVVINLPQRMVGVWNAAFGTTARDPNGPIGLVGVGRIAGQLATQKDVGLSHRFGDLLGLLASLNLALFVFNLVPLLPLDGGHIIGALWEGLKKGFAKLFGRPNPGPVDTARIVPLTFAVVAVLGAMSLLLLYADIVKPITIQ
jgi:membrane-associated protease RseP (regulator of RpoE activity)